MKKNILPTSKSAFSLVELAVVLIIIGIIATGVLQGANLLSSGRLINARSVTSKSEVANIKGLVAWYEPTIKNSFNRSETFDNSQITKWYDISPSSISGQKNALSKSAGSGVIYSREAINKIPGVKFNGTQNIGLNSFYQGSSAQTTVFVVFQPSSTSSLQTLIDSHSSATSINKINIQSSNIQLDSGSVASVSNNFTTGNDYIISAYFNRTASGVYINDAENMTGGNINPGTNELSGLTVGSNKSNGGGFSGFISEIIIYNRPLKNQERKDVMSYLAKKYKITVSNI
jgi:prepilin-type N-terminal cleavage/methylation domain-containing protein